MINIANAQYPTRTKSYQDFGESPYGGGVVLQAVSEIKTPSWTTGIITYGSATRRNSAVLKSEVTYQPGRITTTGFPGRIQRGVGA